LFHLGTKQSEKIDSITGMNTEESILPKLRPEVQLWGVYDPVQKNASTGNNRMVGVVSALTKATAEEEAVRQGLPISHIRLLTSEQVKLIWELAIHSPTQSPATIQPTTAELRTAIEVLKMLGARITEQASHSVNQLPKTELGEQYAGHIEARATEQTGHIEKVSTQLQNWREELLQQQKVRVAQSV
jgi:hypothetical protein